MNDAANAPTAGVEALLRLTLTPGLGPILIARLLARFGSAASVVEASRAALMEVDGIGRERAEAIRRGFDEADVQRELELVAEHRVLLVGIDDPRYPPLLRKIQDPPPLLYVHGDLTPDDVYGIAIVGTRRCTAYGRDQAGRMSAWLAQAGLTIVSGGARGIDAEAHRGAMRGGGRTVAVMGCGLVEPYPPENRELFDSVADGSGAVVSEFPMAAPPSKENFPRRNRIISGMSLATLVVEADEYSGALITARLAGEDHNREVFAMPGRVDSKKSAGCHKMIREGWARLVTSPQDVLESMKGVEHLVAAVRGDAQGLFDSSPEHGLPARAKCDGDHSSSLAELNLTPSQRRILDALTNEPTEIADLAVQTGLSIPTLQADLTLLQIRGLIVRTGPSMIGRAAP